MVLSFVLWYLTLLLVGWLAFPLAARFLSGLADRGYALARPLGLLLWGFVFWLAGSLGLWHNDAGGQIAALLGMAALSVLAGRGRWMELRDWIQKNARVLLLEEALFLLAFTLWTVVRAANPEIAGTEKPMEMAFINAILHSPTFPPHDPWLSGYAISYYYFGYVIVAMLARFSGALPWVGFNLAVASWFALTALAAYGVVYSLLKRWTQRRGENGAALGALLAPLFLLIVSNIEGFLELIHARGWFWSRAADGTLTSGFWKWLNILELDSPPVEPFSWTPVRPGATLWWRGSRVLSDFTLSGDRLEVIDEFPFFSYLLGDLHPHVLAMPFVLLAIGLALNLYLTGNLKDFQLIKPSTWLRRADFWLAAVVLGGLSFLNTWDFPIYVALFSAAYALLRYERRGWSTERLWDFVSMAAVLGVTGGLVYLPFYLGFASQAGGILPSLEFSTRGVHFWVMFAPLLAPVLLWLAWHWRDARGRTNLKSGLLFGLAVLGVLLAVMLLLGFLAVSLPALGGWMQTLPGGEQSALAARLVDAGKLFLQGAHGGASAGEVFAATFTRRLQAPGTGLTLLAMLVLGSGGLAALRRREAVENPVESEPAPDAPRSETGFVILLVLVGAALTLAPEFVYLRDQFGTRMNTIFKFYFQAWIVWSLAAGYATAALWQALRRWTALAFGALMVLLLGMGLAYPALMLPDKTNNFKPGQWTLDGRAYLWQDDAAIVDWLRTAEPGVVAEAVGGSYSSHARISTFSGQPTVLGWVGHELQWRGGTTEMGSRQSDIERLYTTAQWVEAAEILRMYQIRYVVVGSLERSTYRVNDAKFKANLSPVLTTGSGVLYAVPLDVLAETATVP